MAAAIPDDLSFQPQAGFISAPPSSQSQEPSPPHGLLEDEEYERFLSDCNCPPPPTYFAAPPFLLLANL